MKNAHNSLILGVLLVAVSLAMMGVQGCPDDDDSTPAPENVAKAVKAGMELAISSIDFAEQMGTIDKPLQFNPCMVATGSKAGLQMGISNIPAIEKEATEPDGKLHLMGGPVDFTRCMSAEGKPDPWPPLTPDPKAEALVKAAVPLAIGVAKQFIEPKIPTEGIECIKGHVALGVLDATGQVITTTVIDAVNGKPVTTIPEFDATYDMCLPAPTPEPTPVAPAPAEATPAVAPAPVEAVPTPAPTA